MGTIVGTVHHDGVIGNTQFVQQVQHLAHVFVVLDHGVVVERLPAPGLAEDLLRRMHPEVHPGGVEPDEEGFVVIVGALDEILGCGHKLGITCFHAFLGQRAGVFDLLFAHTAPARMLGGIVLVGSPGMHHPTRAKHLFEIWKVLFRRSA